MTNVIDHHAQKIAGALSCFDRLVLQGALPTIAYPQGIATEIDRRDIRLLDYGKQSAQPFRGFALEDALLSARSGLFKAVRR